jgi:hypothetical protein
MSRRGLSTVNEGRVAQWQAIPMTIQQFDDPMFMTSNGLAPLLILTPRHKVRLQRLIQNGNPQ